MAKGNKAPKDNPALEAGQQLVSDKFRTTPIRETITPVRGLHKSAKLYKCPASSFWQFRVYLEGKVRKRSTQEVDLAKADRKAKLIYAELLSAINGSDAKAEPTSRHSLQVVANALWAKNEARIKNGELHKDKVSKDRYVFDRHIKPFFADYNLRDIDNDALEAFKAHLSDAELSKATQLSYLNVVMALLKEAYAKRYITYLPVRPKVRLDDDTRGYFDHGEYTRLWRKAKAAIGSTYEFKNMEGRVYRKTRITPDCYEVIMFMRATYIRPTDLKVLRHRHVHHVSRDGIDFIELRHPATKRHKDFMLSTEHGPGHYKRMRKRREAERKIKPDDYIFLPDVANRDAALDTLGSQFTAILELADLRQDADGNAIMCMAATPPAPSNRSSISASDA